MLELTTSTPIPYDEFIRALTQKFRRHERKHRGNPSRMSNEDTYYTLATPIVISKTQMT